MEQLDPLLQPGAFIDPITPPPSNNPNVTQPKPVPVSEPMSTGPGQGGNSNGHSNTPKQTPKQGVEEAYPNWLPSGWNVIYRTRTSGQTAGLVDKYYVEPETGHRFRSKKEVLEFLQTGTLKKKRKDSDAADSTPGSNASTAKRKKSVTTEKDLMKNFNFDDVPSKVKWELTDIYEGAWRPLFNGVDSVSESTTQEWMAAFSYIALQNAGK